MLVGLLAAGGTGVGVAAAGGTGGTVEVKITDTIKAELPPSQIELLKDQARLESTLTPAVHKLEQTLTAFFGQYREDEAERRRTNDALRAALFGLEQRASLTERELQALDARIRKMEEARP